MADDDDAPAGMNETEKAIFMARKKHAAQEEENMKEYMEQREEERQRLEDELAELKERQIRRREERDAEAETMEQMRRTQEEQRKADEEERKAKMEMEKRKKEAERKKKQAMMAGGGIGGMMSTSEGGKPNFIIAKKEGEENLPSGPKPEPGQTKEEAAAQKEAFMQRYKVPFDGSDMDATDIRNRIKGFHAQLSKTEAVKYDLEQRAKIQEYDLRELRERAKQQARAQAIKKGLDPKEFENLKHPPKKAVASKYDRQIDRRSYSDRKTMYAESLTIDGRKRIPKPKAVFHGSCRPPPEFGRPATKNDELEQLRKTMEPPKYQEAAPVEGAKPPIVAVKAGAVPEDEPEVVFKPQGTAREAEPPAAAAGGGEEEEE
jgi:troponin T